MNRILEKRVAKLEGPEETFLDTLSYDELDGLIEDVRRAIAGYPGPFPTAEKPHIAEWLAQQAAIPSVESGGAQ